MIIDTDVTIAAKTLSLARLICLVKGATTISPTVTLWNSNTEHPQSLYEVIDVDTTPNPPNNSEPDYNTLNRKQRRALAAQHRKQRRK